MNTISLFSTHFYQTSMTCSLVDCLLYILLYSGPLLLGQTH
nr:MAG TPA: hypothetical protein [Bacteriophage sp.]